MHRALYPGSFDPLHNGHVDVITRAAEVAREVVVALATNYSKKYRFSEGERLELARVSLEHLPNVRVELMGGGLLADYAARIRADAIIKGVRSAQDLAYEMPMATMNRELGGVPTLLLPADGPFAHLSSSMVKEVCALGADVEKFVPPAVYRALLAGRVQ